MAMSCIGVPALWQEGILSFNLFRFVNIFYIEQSLKQPDTSRIKLIPKSGSFDSKDNLIRRVARILVRIVKSLSMYYVMIKSGDYAYSGLLLSFFIGLSLIVWMRPRKLAIQL